MAVGSPPRHLQRPSHRRTPSSLEIVPEDLPVMSNPDPKSRSEPQLGLSELTDPMPGDAAHAGAALPGESSRPRPVPASTPGLSRSNSFSNSSYHEDSEDDTAFFPPVERLTMFDFVENLALAQRFEKLQTKLKNQVKNRGITRDRVVDEWRRRVPTEGEQLERDRKSVV